MHILPTFEGYTVDLRLREFRLAIPGEKLEFIPFDSLQGRRLLKGLRELAFEILDAVEGKA